ncbi:hypothetical protein [Salirhabdus salicampi]|nr:hypothetical protein [Salirhabdus salicampi]
MKNDKVIPLKKEACKVEMTNGRDVLKELYKVEKEITIILEDK